MIRLQRQAMRELRWRAAFLVGCILIVAAYWAGLGGPLLLDDAPNLAKVFEWLSGDRSWQSAVLDNTSGYGGRPLSMASFVLDAVFWRGQVSHFKLTNLMLHLACGAALLRLYGSLLVRDPQLARHTPWLAPLLAIAWLLLPIHASTVLYVVQRMAILSALFTILALLVYVQARVAIERGSRLGVATMWIVLPALTLLGFASKENGLLAPLMAGAIELAYFRPPGGSRRPRAVSWFLTATVAVPALVGSALLLSQPDRWLGDYLVRDFTLTERVLTQPRALWDYVAASLLPRTPHLGLFHDNFAVSTGLWSPWTTMPAALGWLLVLLGAVRARTAHPAILGGVLLFLCGHVMESTILPLEMYFEHRNYLPGAGMMLALAGVAGAAAARIPAPSRLFRGAVATVAAMALLVLLAATHGRARVWSSSETLFAQEARFNPDSPRLQSNLAVIAMQADDLDGALGHVARAEAAGQAGPVATYPLWRLLSYCETRTAPPDALYRDLDARARGGIPSYAMQAWTLVVDRAEQDRCTGLDVDRLITFGEAWVDANTLPPRFQESWRPRFDLARLLASQGRLAGAAAQGDRAWRESSANVGVGIFLFRVNASLDRAGMCRSILASLERSEGRGNHRLDGVIASFRRTLGQRRLGADAAVRKPTE